MISKYEVFSTVISSLYHAIQSIERNEMAKYGLKGPHAQCLTVMNRYPDGITAAQLCDLCERDKAAISRTVAELEEAGLLYRKEQNGIRYRVPLVLTQTGVQAADHVTEVAQRAVEQAGAGLNDQQREVFYHVLGVIAKNLYSIRENGLAEKR